MSWDEVKPVVAGGGSPMVSASLKVKKDGSVTLNLFFSSFLMKDMGDPETARAMFGSEEHSGKLRLVFGADGPFKVGASARCFRVSLPAPGFAPHKDFGSNPCAIVSQDNEGKELIVSLPVEAWARGGASATVSAAPAAPAAPKAGSGAISPTNPLDAEKYLTSKGHKCSRQGDGRMAVDGDALLPGQVLALINKYRSRSDLEPLPRASVV